MNIRSLRLQNFRNHSDETVLFDSPITVIYGNNGTGKTAILEAIYIALRGSSFRGTDKDILKNDKPWYRIDVETDSYEVTSVYGVNEYKRKYFLVEDKKSLRLPRQFRRPVVLFTPDDLRLVDGSPSRRRKYLDTFLSQYDPIYARQLRRYERALAQRNKLLKYTETTNETLFSWNVILSDAGTYIINARCDYINKLNQSIQAYYRDISGNNDHVRLEYTGCRASGQQLLHAYEHSLARDQCAQHTSVGPHRHDLEIHLNDRLAEEVASRGEVRTLILALKYREVDIVRAKDEVDPVILLDDVFGELDEVRQNNLLKELDGLQIIITSTHTIGREGIAHIHLAD